MTTPAADCGNASVDASDISKCALHHYHHHLHHGKPRKDDEWTIYAAIVAATPSFRQVVSCATGSKCTMTGPEGWVLRDCHAEVLCRRGLVRELLKEINSSNKLRLLEKDGSSWRLRADTTLHLYVSDSPCGDASIYPLKNNDTMNFTGAKVIVLNDDAPQQHQVLSVHGSECCVAREGIQQLGALRTKSGRSNLPTHLRSTSMSCSDKLMRWCVLGLQGSWLMPTVPIRLSSIVVSLDPNAASLELQQQALERAVCHRVQQVVQELQSRELEDSREREFVKDLSEHALSVHVVEERFPDCKAESSLVTTEEAEMNAAPLDPMDESTAEHTSNKRKGDTLVSESSKKRRTTKSPCGVGINWQWSQDDDTEVLVGSRGIRQGKKPKSTQDYVAMTSRLSRGALLQLTKGSYRALKEQGHTGIRSLVLSTRPFRGWLVGNSDFEMPGS